MQKLFVFILLALWGNASLVLGQQISGTVKDKKSKEPLIGATVFWLNHAHAGAATNLNGEFLLERHSPATKLIISSVGYRTDTVEVGTASQYHILLESSSNELGEVVVKSQATSYDRLSPIQTEIITSKALAKAACCNLSESFETNASVSVNYSDAVTGSKQIQLLGLAGTYVQLTTENIPSLRGLASTFGLNYIPGTWIQSIDLSKGTNSVLNGYEAMTGAINVELQKPDLANNIYLNVYANHFGRGEINANFAKKLSSKWSVGLLSHGSFLKNRVDNNQDGFMDLPTYGQVNLLNRWKYASDRWMAQFGVNVLTDNRLAGQLGFKDRASTPTSYGFTNNTNRIDFFSKTARLFPNAPYRGMGLILNAINHQSDSWFGRTPYAAKQQQFYANFIYQDILGTTEHSYKVGSSLLLDNYDEQYGGVERLRNEVVPGVFAEYIFNRLDKTVIVAGSRVDFHNLVGTQFTPRLHLKQELGWHTTARLSVGRGFRIPNPLAENYGNLVSSRKIVWLSNDVKPEISWNYGLSLLKHVGKSNIVFDVYYTDFKRKMLVDAEHLAHLYFYSSTERAYATSAQIELNYVPADRWELKAAYRYVDSKQTVGLPKNESVLLPVMFLSRDRILLNAAYALPYDKWKFDATWQWNGKRRIPMLDEKQPFVSYASMPVQFAPAFGTLNAQVTRTFVKGDVYLGGENLTNFRQLNPIIDPQNPFGNRFDAGMAWGPVVGRLIYAGLRWKY